MNHFAIFFYFYIAFCFVQDENPAGISKVMNKQGQRRVSSYSKFISNSYPYSHKDRSSKSYSTHSSGRPCEWLKLSKKFIFHRLWNLLVVSNRPQ